MLASLLCAGLLMGAGAPRAAMALTPRPITMTEVQQALQARFQRPIPSSAILFSPPETDAAGNAGVVVEAVRFDQARDRLAVRCRATQDAKLLPFWVAIALRRTEMRTLAANFDLRRPPRAAPARALPSGPILVQPGQTAEMDVFQKGFSLTTQVMPLEAGRAGERVRALSLATHAMLEVQVAGRNKVMPVTVITEAPHAVR